MWERNLKQSLSRCRNRGLSILARWGVRYDRRMSINRYTQLLAEIPDGVLGEIDRLRVENLLKEEVWIRDELQSIEPIIADKLDSDRIAQKLISYHGLGDKLARVLSWYVGDWKRFPNGKSFAAYCGLTSVHVRSGSSDTDKGVSRAGHPVLRGAFSQLTLLWLRWQSESELAIRTREQITRGKAGRLARTALARRLAVALWNWVVYDRPIPGGRFSEKASGK